MIDLSSSEHQLPSVISQHPNALNGFLLIIVGLANAPAGLYVSVHDHQSCYRLVSSGSAGEQA
jgi:hypothetical protein